MKCSSVFSCCIPIPCHGSRKQNSLREERKRIDRALSDIRKNGARAILTGRQKNQTCKLEGIFPFQIYQITDPPWCSASFTSRLVFGQGASEPTPNTFAGRFDLVSSNLTGDPIESVNLNIRFAEDDGRLQKTETESGIKKFTSKGQDQVTLHLSADILLGSRRYSELTLYPIQSSAQ